MSDQHPMTRRCALGMLALGTSAPLLTACGSSEGGGEAAGSASPTPSDAPSSSAPASKAGADALVAVSEVPVGGGVILAGAEVIVTQPSKGEFKGFSAICPHAQVLLSDASAEEQIFCGNGHGSRFTLDDGSVLNGPATSPLQPVNVTVRDGQVVRA